MSVSLPARLLTEREAAEILCVSPGTLCVWRCTRRYPTLRYTKIGRAVRYSVDDLEQFIRDRSVGGDPD